MNDSQQILGLCLQNVGLFFFLTVQPLMMNSSLHINMSAAAAATATTMNVPPPLLQQLHDAIF